MKPNRCASSIRPPRRRSITGRRFRQPEAAMRCQDESRSDRDAHAMHCPGEHRAVSVPRQRTVANGPARRVSRRLRQLLAARLFRLHRFGCGDIGGQQLQMPVSDARLRDDRIGKFLHIRRRTA